MKYNEDFYIDSGFYDVYSVKESRGQPKTGALKQAIR